jgi:multidrug efflux system membrane fusion protein
MDHSTPTTLAPERPSSPPLVENKSGRSWRLWVWLLLLAALGAGAYYYWPKLKPTGATNAAPAAAGKKGRGAGAIPVIAVTAQTGNIGVYITGMGNVIPIYTVTLKSRVDGELTKVLYTEGQLVRQGDLLAEIDPRPYQVLLEQAEGQLAKDQATLHNARVDQDRYQKLLAQNAIPEQQLTTQKATVEQAEGAVKSDQGAIDNAKLDLVYCRITAPITGRVGLRLVDPGNIVHATDTTGLVVITQVDPISVIFTISEGDIPPVIQRLRAGQHLKVEALDNLFRKTLATGTLQTIDNQIDQTTGTVKLRAQFENKRDALFPNQIVNPRLLVEEKHGVTLVPNAAIQRNSQSTYVWLVKPDRTVTVRPVTVGTQEGDQTEIVTGLAPGEVVITDGVDKLQEGTRVRVASDQGGGAKPRGGAKQGGGAVPGGAKQSGAKQSAGGK